MIENVEIEADDKPCPHCHLSDALDAYITEHGEFDGPEGVLEIYAMMVADALKAAETDGYDRDELMELFLVHVDERLDVLKEKIHESKKH